MKRYSIPILFAFAAAVLSAFGKVDVLCIYYPEWHVYPEGDVIFGKGRTEWDFVNTAVPRFPGHEQPIRLVDGNPDDSNPADVAKEIDYAADAGIDVFVYDWYWADHKPIQHEALERGFLKAPNRGRMKFALMWANHNRSDVFRSAPGKCNDRFFWRLKYDREEFLEAIDYCIKAYFGSPQYYRKDGRLFLSIYSAMQLVNGLGGSEATKAVFAEAQKRVKDAGLPPLHLSAMIHGKEQADVVNAAGFDSTAAYNVTPYDFDDSDIKEEKGETRQLYSHEEFAELHGPFNRKMAEFSVPPYMPVVARGWDASPRCRNDEPFPWKTLMYPYLGIVRDTAPKWFRRSLEIVKAQALADPKKPGAILINAWNEYTEGCYLMPDTKNGDAYLKAIKSVFKNAAEPWFGKPIPGSGEKPGVEDCGMSAAKVFDAPIKGLKRIGTLAVPKSAEVPESSNASIGFEGLDRGLFDPDRCYDALAAAGVKWARVQTMWSRCEKEKGVYDFSVLDGVVENLSRRGVRPWFSVTFGNTVYMTNCYTGAAVGCVPTLYGDECRAAWCAYVRKLARRYKGRVTHWEIWNEPNIDHFWQPTKPNAAAYLELVKLTGGVVREEIPDAKIGGTTSSPALNDWERRFFELGGAASIDFWSGHAYGCVPERLRHKQKVADEPTDDYVAVLNDVRKFIDANGGRHVEIWQGESGFPSWFPESHWLYSKGVCKEGWQSQANQAKWLLRRFVTDRRAGIARSSFYQMADISRHYSMATITRKHPAEHGILNGWTYKPKMSCRAFGSYNAILATAKCDASVETSVSPSSDGGAPTVSAAFRSSDGSPFFLYYTAFDFSLSYTGACYAARCDAKLTVPAKLAPESPVLVDMLRGGVYEVLSRIEANDTVTFGGLPLVDYPLVLADRRCVKLVAPVSFSSIGCPDDWRKYALWK